MSQSTIGHLTFEELKQIIRATVTEIQSHETLQPQWLGNPTPEGWQIFLAGFIDQPDAPSPRQMLREERAR